jgi:hypothetical protein
MPHGVSFALSLPPTRTECSEFWGARARDAHSAESRDCWKTGRYDQMSRACTRSRMRPRLGRASPGTYRPVGQERQNAGHTARSCFVWPRHLQRVTYLLANGWAYCKRADGPPFSKLARTAIDHAHVHEGRSRHDFRQLADKAREVGTPTCATEHLWTCTLADRDKHKSGTTTPSLARKPDTLRTGP